MAPRRRGALTAPGSLAAMALPGAYLDEFSEPSGYLDFAAVGPLSRTARQAVVAAVARQSAAETPPTGALLAAQERAVARAAALLGTTADLVTMIPSTSAGLFQVAFGLPPGNVVVPAGEFPANRYPWLRAAARGGPAVRLVDEDRGRLTADVIRPAVDAGTVAVVVSHVGFRSGFRADLGALREAAGDALLVVDAIQSLGALRFPAGVADVVVAGGQKWLRAGWGAGVLAVSPRALDRLLPGLSGWVGVEDFLDTDRPAPHDLLPGADRLRMGSPAFFAAPALEAALAVIEIAGSDAIEEAVLAGSRLVEEAVRRGGAEVLDPWRHDRERSGIVSFRLPGEPVAATCARLAAAGFVVAERGSWLRASPHASSRRDAIAGLAGVLAAAGD